MVTTVTVTIPRRCQEKTILFGASGLPYPKISPDDSHVNLCHRELFHNPNEQHAALDQFLGAGAMCLQRRGETAAVVEASRGTKRDGFPPIASSDPSHLTDPTIAAFSISCVRTSPYRFTNTRICRLGFFIKHPEGVAQSE
jgi:hypothetical protein